MLGIGSRNWAARHKRRYSGLLTIEDPDARRRLRCDAPPQQLVLRFVDMDADWPEPVPSNDPWRHRLATKDDVIAALSFASNHERLLVHCEAGVGRSTATALAIIAERMGKGREAEAMAEVLRLRPEASPNLRVVELADDILGCDGALLAEVIRHTETNPKIRRRRQLSLAVHLQDRGYPESFWKFLRTDALFRLT